ncbi:MAG: hypothetical protein LBQ54_12570 [Planctomycetaceae bacterium]|jgi:hypothetical protein|nr:hypothetical protein [Planctomycetaceae bacterium]
MKKHLLFSSAVLLIVCSPEIGSVVLAQLPTGTFPPLSTSEQGNTSWNPPLNPPSPPPNPAGETRYSGAAAPSVPFRPQPDDEIPQPSVPPSNFPSMPPSGPTPPLPTTPSSAVPFAGTPAQGETSAPPQLNRDIELRAVVSENHPLWEVLRLERPEDSAVTGRELYLHELLAGVTSPGIRKILIKEYWLLTEKYLTYKYRLLQLYLLYDKISVSFGQDDLMKPQIDLAIERVEGQQKAAELEFIQAQYRFSELVKQYNSGLSRRSDPASGLFIPADCPLALPYNTQSEKLAVSSPKARLLDKTIPLQYEVITNKRNAGKATKSYLNSLMTNRQPSISTLSDCIEEHIGILKAVIEYNHQIADYVAETVGSNVTGRRFLSTVILLKPPAPANPVTQVNAQRENENANPPERPVDF